MAEIVVVLLGVYVLLVIRALSNSERFTKVKVYDHSVGFDGAFIWHELPEPMSRRQAKKYANKMGWMEITKFGDKEE